jgi:hypothetical protein
MKKIMAVIMLLLGFFICGQVSASSVIDFEGENLRMPYISGEYVLYSFPGIEVESIGEGYLSMGFCVTIERLDGEAFRILGFDGRSLIGEIVVTNESRSGSFTIGTDTFQSAIPSIGWDMNESSSFFSFLGVADIDNIELAEKVLIPKPDPVPLPGAIWMMGAGLSGIAAYRRRRRD